MADQPRTTSEWLWWVPERGETKEDAREHSARSSREPEFVAHDIAEKDWHYQSPDYWEELEIVLVPPGSEREMKFRIYTESRPHFSVYETKS